MQAHPEIVEAAQAALHDWLEEYGRGCEVGAEMAVRAYSETRRKLMNDPLAGMNTAEQNHEAALQVMEQVMSLGTQMADGGTGNLAAGVVEGMY